MLVLPCNQWQELIETQPDIQARWDWGFTDVRNLENPNHFGRNQVTKWIQQQEKVFSNNWFGRKRLTCFVRCKKKNWYRNETNADAQVYKQTNREVHFCGTTPIIIIFSFLLRAVEAKLESCGCRKPSSVAAK